MRRLQSCFWLVLALQAFPTLCVAQPSNDQVTQLRSQLEELEARVSDLERRLRQQADEKKSSSSQPLPAAQQQWRRLSKGQSRDVVRNVLGEPKRIDGGTLEYWFYSDRDRSGPHVYFGYSGLSGWREP